MMRKLNFIQVSGNADFLRPGNSDRRFWPVTLPVRVQTLAILFPANAADRASAVTGCTNCLKGFREGVARIAHWRVLSDMVNAAIALDAIDGNNAMREHFAAADCALDAIYHRLERTQSWGRHPVPHIDELDALREAVELFALKWLEAAPADAVAAFAACKRDPRASGTAAPAPITDTNPLPIQEILL